MRNFAKCSPRQKSVMKYELGIRVDIQTAVEGYHAVMHLRNCEPRGKENAKNISFCRAELPRWLILSTKCCATLYRGPRKLSQLVVTLVAAYNYIKTVHDGNYPAAFMPRLCFVLGICHITNPTDNISSLPVPRIIAAARYKSYCLLSFLKIPAFSVL